MTQHAEPIVDEIEAVSLTSGLAGSVEALFSAGGLAETLRCVVDVTVTTIRACDFAGFAVLTDDLFDTAAHTDPVVVKVDALQCRFGEGPCIDAADSSAVVIADVLVDDPRWPRFGPAAHAAGIRSALAVPLSMAKGKGILTAYSRSGDAFGGVERARGVVLAQMAGAAVGIGPGTGRRRGSGAHAQGRAGDPGDDRPGRGDPHGARAHQLRRGVRHPAPVVPASEREAP